MRKKRYPWKDSRRETVGKIIVWVVAFVLVMGVWTVAINIVIDHEGNVIY